MIKQNIWSDSMDVTQPAKMRISCAKSVGFGFSTGMDIAVRNRYYHTATGNHMPYGITVLLPPGRGDFPAFTPAEAGTRFSDPVMSKYRQYVL